MQLVPAPPGSTCCSQVVCRVQGGQMALAGEGVPGVAIENFLEHFRKQPGHRYAALGRQDLRAAHVLGGEREREVHEKQCSTRTCETRGRPPLEKTPPGPLRL